MDFELFNFAVEYVVKENIETEMGFKFAKWYGENCTPGDSVVDQWHAWRQQFPYSAHYKKLLN